MRSKDRNRYCGQERPQRKGYRPYRNRAMVYTLIETGMRRAAIRNLNLKDVNFKKRSVSAEEKGGRTHGYKISREGLAAIKDYVEKERAQDFKKWRSPALFLSPATSAHGNGRLNPKVINTAWNEVCRLAGVEGHTPHDARHAMGKHLIEKTGNLAAVQRQHRIDKAAVVFVAHPVHSFLSGALTRKTIVGAVMGQVGRSDNLYPESQAL